MGKTLASILFGINLATSPAFTEESNQICNQSYEQVVQRVQALDEGFLQVSFIKILNIEGGKIIKIPNSQNSAIWYSFEENGKIDGKYVQQILGPEGYNKLVRNVQSPEKTFCQNLEIMEENNLKYLGKRDV